MSLASADEPRLRRLPSPVEGVVRASRNNRH